MKNIIKIGNSQIDLDTIDPFDGDIRARMGQSAGALIYYMENCDISAADAHKVFSHLSGVSLNYRNRYDLHNLMVTYREIYLRDK